MFEPDDLGSSDALLLTFGPRARSFRGAVADELAVLAEAGFTEVVDIRILGKDVRDLATKLALGGAAGDVAYRNTRAVSLRGRARRSGARVLASGHVPTLGVSW
jgi:hypothetical protein